MRTLIPAALGAAALLACAPAARAADHLDTPSVVADPRADIGDLYAWMSPDGRRLNLAMTIVGHSFDDGLGYRFHVDSGAQFGAAKSRTSIVCQRLASAPACRVENGRGDGGLQVFAGRRDDPFFNNVRGTREAYEAAAAALPAAARDPAGCPAFGRETARQVLGLWRQTKGGPAQNLLAGWTPASLVVSVDVEAVRNGGPMLAVWGDTARGDKRIDRMGRPLTGNAMLGPLAPEAQSHALKERYNAVAPEGGDAFVSEIEQTLGLYDGFDGRCGDAFLARAEDGAARYLRLAILLADDRLWVDSRKSRCGALFAVELAALERRREFEDDCGGRAPSYDAVDTYRSLLVSGTVAGVDDGVPKDDQAHSDTDFPFLAPPAAEE